MNILFLSEYYRPFEIGGAERSAERLAIELTATGTPVSVATPNYGAPDEEVLQGVKIQRLPFPQTLRPGELARRIWWGNPFLHFGYAAAIARRIRAADYRIIHIQNSGMLLAGAWAARLTHRPIVVTIRDLAYLDPTTHGPLHGLGNSWKWRVDAWWAGGDRWLRRRALRGARIIFVSRALRDLYSDAGVVDVSRARVIYNIGPAPFSGPWPTRDPRRVLFVGKLSAGKGLDILYTAADLVRRSTPSVHFDIVGLPGVGFHPPPPSLADAFSFHGRLESPGVQDLMRSRAVLAAPAVWPEPLSRVLLEAMANRLPIVASAVGGTVEVFEHATHALLVKPGDAAALADALTTLLRNPGLGEKLARSAEARLVSLFSADAIVPQVLSVYREAQVAD